MKVVLRAKASIGALVFALVTLFALVALALAGAPAASAYGPAPHITVSCTVAGNQVVCQVSGSGFDPGAPVTVAIAGSSGSLGTYQADPSGAFGPDTFTLSCGFGGAAHTFTGSDPEGQVAEVEYTVPAVAGCQALFGSSGSATAGSGGSAALPSTAASAAPSHGSLAFTGADVTLTVAVAAALLALGGMIVASSRRRRDQWSSSGS